MDIAEAKAKLASRDNAFQQGAAEWLSQNVDSAANAAVELVANVGSQDRTLAEYCVAALEELEEPNHQDLPRLAALTGSDNADVAYWSATLIGRCGQAAAAQAAALGDIVASDAPSAVRQRAAWAIAKIGPPAASVRPQLESAVDAEPASLARAVAKALEAIAP